MAAPYVPSPLDCVGRKRFVFYPPIEHGGPNEWLLAASSRAAVQAVNAHSGIKIWVDRQYIGAVSDHTDVLTVGLRKTLQMHNGAVVPSVKRVIEMPPATGHPLSSRRERGPASVVAIRLDDGKKSSVNKLVVAVAIASLMAALFAAWFVSAAHF